MNITNIIKKRAYLYLDQDLAHTFDELLENGYELVLNKKHERDTLKELEENLKVFLLFYSNSFNFLLEFYVL